MADAIRLSRFSREQVRVQLYRVAHPTPSQIADCLEARARHFRGVIAGPSARFLHKHELDDLAAWAADCERNAAKARKAIAQPTLI